jgi:hypothetical protein
MSVAVPHRGRPRRDGQHHGCRSTIGVHAVPISLLEPAAQCALQCHHPRACAEWLVTQSGMASSTLTNGSAPERVRIGVGLRERTCVRWTDCGPGGSELEASSTGLGGDPARAATLTPSQLAGGHRQRAGAEDRATQLTQPFPNRRPRTGEPADPAPGTFPAHSSPRRSISSTSGHRVDRQAGENRG